MALVVLIERHGLRLATDSPVVKRADWAVVAQVDAALAEAQRLAADATAQERLAAEAAGYGDGFRAGREEGAASLAAAALRRHTLVEQLEPVIAQIVVEAVGAVLQRIGRERVLFESLSAVREVVRRAQWAVLRVPPALQEAARAALRQLEEELAGSVAVQLLADAALAEDACVLETDSGVVDAGLGTLMQAVRSAVSASLQGALHADAALAGP